MNLSDCGVEENITFGVEPAGRSSNSSVLLRNHILGGIGMMLNILAVLLLLLTRGIRPPLKLAVINMTLNDLLLMTILVVWTEWTPRQFPCWLALYITTSSVLVSYLINCVLAVHNYVSVFYPHRARHALTLGRILAAVVSCWLVGFLIGLACLGIHLPSAGKACYVMSTMPRLGVVIGCFFLLVCSCFIIVANGRIFAQIKRQYNLSNRTAGQHKNSNNPIVLTLTSSSCVKGEINNVKLENIGSEAQVSALTLPPTVLSQHADSSSTISEKQTEGPSASYNSPPPSHTNITPRKPSKYLYTKTFLTVTSQDQNDLESTIVHSKISQVTVDIHDCFYEGLDQSQYRDDSGVDHSLNIPTGSELDVSTPPFTDMPCAYQSEPDGASDTQHSQVCWANDLSLKYKISSDSLQRDRSCYCRRPKVKSKVDGRTQSKECLTFLQTQTNDTIILSTGNCCTRAHHCDSLVSEQHVGNNVSFEVEEETCDFSSVSYANDNSTISQTLVACALPEYCESDGQSLGSPSASNSPYKSIPAVTGRNSIRCSDNAQGTECTSSLSCKTQEKSFILESNRIRPQFIPNNGNVQTYNGQHSNVFTVSNHPIISPDRHLCCNIGQVEHDLAVKRKESKRRVKTSSFSTLLTKTNHSGAASLVCRKQGAAENNTTDTPCTTQQVPSDHSGVEKEFVVDKTSENVAVNAFQKIKEAVAIGDKSNQNKLAASGCDSSKACKCTLRDNPKGVFPNATDRNNRPYGLTSPASTWDKSPIQKGPHCQCLNVRTKHDLATSAASCNGAEQSVAKGRTTAVPTLLSSLSSAFVSIRPRFEVSTPKKQTRRRRWQQRTQNTVLMLCSWCCVLTVPYIVYGGYVSIWVKDRESFLNSGVGVICSSLSVFNCITNPVLCAWRFVEWPTIWARIKASRTRCC